jgi:pyruvate formate-lyase activating enzyme-like uncharacterized protein
MTVWKRDSVGSFWNYLSKGCQICHQGAGLVLFITGRCNRGCLYCPISKERSGQDLIFADEKPVKCLEDIIEEARAIGALGTGITGGEPLLELERVMEYIITLKKEFGLKHHVHLYTGILPNLDILRKLKRVGLDEIRFHPPSQDWFDAKGLREALSFTTSLGIEAGVEIPAIGPAPGIIEAIRSSGAFLNLNELEFSETNAQNLKKLGFRPHDIGSGVVGSDEIAGAFMLGDLKVHYCPSRFKDAVQLRERLKRRAERVARSIDIVTEDGTLIHGIITGDLKRALIVLEKLGVPEGMYDTGENRIDIEPYLLEEISKELKGIGCIISLIERYPLEDGLVVESIPL